MWEAYFVQTTTGQLGPKIHFSDHSWSISLNDTEEFSITIPKSSLPSSINNSLWFKPWWGGAVLVWNGTPIVAGPMVSEPSESRKDIKLSYGGIRTVLAKRYVVREQENWLKINTDVVSYKGMSLGTIARKVVQFIQQKPGGTLPISFPQPDEIGKPSDDTHTRTYNGFNVQNLSCDAVLTKLSNVTGGPDIMFKPRFIEDNLLTYDMVTGTENQPRIAQTTLPVFDTTAENSVVENVSIVTTGTYMTNRVYGIGAGQDKGQIIRIEHNLTSTGQGFPLLETTFSDTSQEKPWLVSQHARAQLYANLKPLQEIQFSVSANQVPELGSYWSGDKARIILDGSWLTLPKGESDVRILNFNGDQNSMVKLSVQTEDRFKFTDAAEDAG